MSSHFCFSAASQGAAHGSPPSPTRVAGSQLALVITGLQEANGAQEASGWAPLLAHTYTRFCFPQTCTKVEAKSGGSPCAAQVWEHARMQRVCPDQFVTPKLGILSGLPPSTTFSLKRASDWDTGLGRPKRDSFCLCLNLAGALETPGSTFSTGSSLGRLLN